MVVTANLCDMEAGKISIKMKIVCMLFACILLLNLGSAYAQENKTTTNLTQNINSPETPDRATDVNSSCILEEPVPKTNYAGDEGLNKSNAAAGPSTLNGADIEDAAVRLDDFIKTNERLPAYITVGGEQLNPATFLQLLTAYLTDKTLEPRIVGLPTNSTGTNLKGSIVLEDYIELAEKVYSFIELNSRAPNFATFNNQQIKFESLTWLFARAISFKAANQRLPNYVNLENLNKIKTLPLSDDPTNSNNNSETSQIGEGGENSSGAADDPNISMYEVLSAAKRLKDFIESNKRLPSYVTVSDQNLGVAQFLELMLKVIIQINSGQTSPLIPRTVTEAPNPSGSGTGQITKSEYIQLTNKILNFITAYARAPNYVTTSIGSISYPNIVYAMSRILTFYNDNNRLPSYVTVKEFSGQSSNNELGQYLVATANCQVNDPSIQSLAAQLTAGLTGEWDKARAVFNWVRDNIDYSFYYNTRYGAVGTLKYKTGNCCDHAHLVVALARAAGLPARYVHGICTFSSGTYGHVWAQIYVNGKWYNADATSTRNSLGVVNSWNTATATILGVYASLPF
ncbi:MAG TPA: pseudomurein-binding repeat-containing protein [Methanothermobacter sp.]|nr:pseudomurein-binding repeat-containing protein [Methanothermobacter sp.]